MADSDDDYMIETGIENASAFKTAWTGEPKDFLKREDYIGVRGTAIGREELEFLVINKDIDGVSIHWSDIGKGLDLAYTHLTLAPSVLNIRPIYSVVKKHLKLPEYGSTGVANLRNCFGCQIMYYGGWETWLCFVPKTNDRREYTHKMLRDATAENVRRCRVEFQKQLKELVCRGIARDTLAKNNLEDLKKMFVLPGDRRVILSVFQSAVEATELAIAGMVPMLFSFRFGEKCRTPVLLPILDEGGVKDICVHVGIEITDHMHDFLWCREGVNAVVGDRGVLTSALSFFECVNFQSNLDEKRIDVKGKLLEVCRCRDTVRFVQLYVDTPHRRPPPVVHPISATVLFVAGLLRETSHVKLNRDAMAYLSELSNNFNQLRDGRCRLEFVFGLPAALRSVVASDFVDENALFRLLNEEAMIVPFEVSADVIKCVRDVGLYLCEQLMNIYRTRRGTGDSVSAWEAFQYECAAERLLWGNPLCSQSWTYSVNLGVGLASPSRCLTDQRGFLCLEASSACCADEDTSPPLNIYSRNITLQRQVTRIFGLYNYIHSASIVLGRRVMMILLRDLHEIGHVFLRVEEFLLLLKRSSGHGGKKIVGGIRSRDLAEKLAQCKGCKWPMVFGAVKRLLDNDNDRLVRLCVEGIEALGLGYFPAVRSSDASRHPGLCWQFTYGYWVLLSEDSRRNDYESEAASMHTLVLGQLEAERLCHTSQYERQVFPWLKPVLEKIAEKQLTREQKVTVLAFVSAVALISNGRYVDYLCLSRLERKLPLTQTMLRMLEVQCKFQLGTVTTFQLWKLHPSIPHKLEPEKPASGTQRSTSEAPVPHNRDDDELAGMVYEAGNESAHQMEKANSRHLPTSCQHGSWSPVETEIVREVMNAYAHGIRGRYSLYQEKCRLKGIPDRTFRAFQEKSLKMFPRKRKLEEPKIEQERH